jgi:hypothetical protein
MIIFNRGMPFGSHGSRLPQVLKPAQDTSSKPTGATKNLFLTCVIDACVTPRIFDMPISTRTFLVVYVAGHPALLEEKELAKPLYDQFRRELYENDRRVRNE